MAVARAKAWVRLGSSLVREGKGGRGAWDVEVELELELELDWALRRPREHLSISILREYCSNSRNVRHAR